MRRLLLLAALALALAAPLGGPAPAAAAPGAPLGLHVVGGDRWQAEPSFDLKWTNPPLDGAPRAMPHYRVRDPGGEEIARASLAPLANSVADLRVGPAPGVYSAEVWIEDRDGAAGPAASVPLRFDDERPPPVDAPEPPGWLGRGAFPLRLGLGPPLGGAPASGIHGYAVAIDADPAGAPCAVAGRCAGAETTAAGEMAGAFEVAALPNGTHHLHLATVSGAGVSSVPTHAALRVDTTDPVTRLRGVPSGWSSRPVRLTARAADDGAGMEHDGHGPPPLTAIRVDGGAPRRALGASVGATVIGEGRHTVVHYARDAAGNVSDGEGLDGVNGRAPASAVVRIDRGAPRVAFADSEPSADPDLIRARVADPLSGPDLRRGRIEARPLGSGRAFRPLAPAPPGAGELRARWDSDAVPAGPYELRAIAYDAAGNATVGRRRGDGRAMIVASPLRQPTRLLTGFGGRTLTWHRCVRRRRGRSCRRETIASYRRRPASRTVPFGRGVRIGGRLLTTGGGPVAGAPVRIAERFAPGGKAGVRVSTLWTGPDGTFLGRLEPGPSREVTMSFGGDRRLVRAAGRPLRLGVRPAVRLRASSGVAAVGGAPLVFRGRVMPPGSIPDGGLPVQLQFRLPGRPWTEFRTARTDERGRFRYAYRFSDDDSRGVRFHFRAHLPAQGNWPYAPGSSRPLQIRGR